RFNDPRLSAAILHHIVTHTNPAGADADGADPMVSEGIDLAARKELALLTVPADLHEQAFAAVQDLAATFGEKSGTTVIQGEPTQQIEWISTALQQQSEASSELLSLASAARDARLPRGF